MSGRWWSSCFPAPGSGRRPGEHWRREVVGVVYVVRTGCAWRRLPAGSLPGGRCVGTSCGGGEQRAIQRMLDVLRQQVQRDKGQGAAPSVSPHGCPRSFRFRWTTAQAGTSWSFVWSPASGRGRWWRLQHSQVPPPRTQPVPHNQAPVAGTTPGPVLVHNDNEVPGWAASEIARIKAGQGTPRTVSPTDPTQKLYQWRESARRAAKWGPHAESGFQGSPEWEVPGKGDTYRIVGPNRFGEYG